MASSDAQAAYAGKTFFPHIIPNTGDDFNHEGGVGESGAAYLDGNGSGKEKLQGVTCGGYAPNAHNGNLHRIVEFPDHT